MKTPTAWSKNKSAEADEFAYDDAIVDYDSVIDTYDGVIATDLSDREITPVDWDKQLKTPSDWKKATKTPSEWSKS